MSIVPSPRLLFWTAVVLIPAASVAVALPAAMPLGLGICAALAGVVISDAFFSSRVLHGLSAETAPVVRLLKGRTGDLEVFLRNRSQRSRFIRFGLDLDPDLAPYDEPTAIQLPAGAELSRIGVPVTPRRRGSFSLRRCFVEARSPLGFWERRRPLGLETEIRVYPNLATERKAVAALFLNRGSLGVHAQRQVGKGREFEKLRDYLPGDGIEDIHWKATAKRGHPVTKVFQIEKTQEVYVVIDASRLSGRPAASSAQPAAALAGGARGTRAESAGTVTPEEESSVPVAALERFVTAGLMLGAAAERQGDHFGLLTFSDRIHAFLRASNGQAHFSTCRDALYALEPRIVAPDYDELFTFIRMRLRRRALIVFLTALDDPVLAESFTRNVDLVRRQHLVLVNMLRPAGAESLFSHPDVETVDDVYTRLGGHLIWTQLRELEGTLNSRGVRFSLLDDERLSAQLVTQYLSVKQRQIL